MNRYQTHQLVARDMLNCLKHIASYLNQEQRDKLKQHISKTRKDQYIILKDMIAEKVI